jgi:hypothetical protein
VNTKHLTLSVIAFVPLAVVGCALSYHRSDDNDGFDFSSGNVNKIIKGKTTANELIQLFGGPLSKSEVSENEEEWKYSYSTSIKIEEKYFLTDEVQSTGHHKTLDILLKNGTVTSFTYSESH